MLLKTLCKRIVFCDGLSLLLTWQIHIFGDRVSKRQ